MSWWKTGLVAVVSGIMACGCGQSDAQNAPLKSHALWLTSMDEAQKAAKEKNLPILADFSGSDWCGWCIRLEKEVFSEPEFRKFAQESLVLLLVDFPRKTAQSEEQKKANRALAEAYGIRGFPTVVLLDAAGKELARTGYRPGGAGLYVGHLKELLDGAKK